MNTRSPIDNERFLGLKRHVEQDFLWKPDLYVGLSYRNERNTSKQCFKDFLKWSFLLSRRCKSHIQPFAAVEANGRKHLHAILNSERPIDQELAKRLWNDKHGIADIRKYNPELGGVIYIYDHHEEWSSTVVCPHRSGACRRGACRFRKHSVLKPNRVKTEEAIKVVMSDYKPVVIPA